MGDQEKLRLEHALREAVTAYSRAVTKYETIRKDGAEEEIGDAAREVSYARERHTDAKGALERHQAGKAEST